MRNHAALDLHSGNLPDPSKNPAKWEKLRVRVARLETKLNVMQRGTIAELVELLSPRQLVMTAAHMDTTDFTTSLGFMDADTRRAFLAGAGTTMVLGHLRRVPPNKRDDILEMLDDDMRHEARLALAGNQRAEGREFGRSDFYDVMGRFWTAARGEPAAKWNSGHHMARGIEQREHGNEASVVGRIADTVTEIRDLEKMVLGKRAQLEQLSISRRKQTIRRIRLLRSGNTASKMEQASAMASRLAESDANDRHRDRREAAGKQRRRLRMLEERARTAGLDGVHVNGAPAEEADDDRELFGGLEHVPAELRKW